MGELPPVKKAAAVFRQYCYDYRDQLMAGIIVAGWDPKDGGQVIDKLALSELCCVTRFDK